MLDDYTLVALTQLTEELDEVYFPLTPHRHLRGGGPPHTADLSERESQLMLRLQLGLPAALVPIASALGTNLNRAQYLALHRAALTTPAALQAADPAQLLTIVDGDKELRQLILDAAEQLNELEQAA